MEVLTLGFMGLVLLLVVGPRLTFTPEGCVKVLTSFGKYSRIVQPGASWRKPWERAQAISLQNRSMELEFEAFTIDQANVYFKCLLLYRVADSAELTVKRAAFAFAKQEEFSISMQRLIEDETRTYVATQRQAEMIGISQDVVRRIQSNVGARMRDWGYSIEDLRYNNIRFDAVVTSSMARVVAAINERDAAENEGEALLIRRTKEAEADGSFIKIKAEAENAKAGHTIFVDSNPSRPRELMADMAAFYKVAPSGVPADLAATH